MARGRKSAPLMMQRIPLIPLAAVAASSCQNYSATVLPPSNATVISLVVRGYERFVYGDREGFLEFNADGSPKDAPPTITYQQLASSASSSASATASVSALLLALPAALAAVQH